MKKINENIKHIIVLIVAIVISSMISIKAATTLSSTSVYYDTSKSGGSSSNVNGAIDELYSLTTDRDKLKQEILDLTWPVGSVYISTTDSSVESVQERFGGSWVKYAEDMTLVGASSSKAVNTTGGSSTVTLSVANVPAHTHSLKYYGGDRSYGITTTWPGAYNGSYGSVGHTHTFSGTTGWMNQNYSHAHTVTASGSVSSSFSGTAGTTGSTGSGSSFSIQNPYTAVYMYKRTA